MFFISSIVCCGLVLVIGSGKVMSWSMSWFTGSSVTKLVISGWTSFSFPVGMLLVVWKLISVGLLFRCSMIVLTMFLSLSSLTSIFFSIVGSGFVVVLVFWLVWLMVVFLVFGLRMSAHLIPPKPTGVDMATCFFW